MLLSVSRRTDIPAWYADWFFRRLAEGFALVPSPRAPHRLHHIPRFRLLDQKPSPYVDLSGRT